jgi:hypothetical protein
MMLRRTLHIAVVALAAPSAAGAAEWVKVGGSETRFATAIISQVEGKPVTMVLTGTAMRRKYGFNVYAMASYVQAGATVRDAQELLECPQTKQLHLVFQRAVDGKSMASAFRDAIGQGHPAPEFAPELNLLEAFFYKHPAKPGDQVTLTAVPHVGLVCQKSGHNAVVIPNVHFAQAAWEVYFGPHNLGLAIKTGLSSRLVNR